MQPRQAAKNVGRTALILVASTTCTMVFWFVVWLMYFTNTPILRTMAVEVRQPAAAVMVHVATHFLVFWWFWMRSERDRDFHPLLVGVVAGLATALSYDGYEWIVESAPIESLSGLAVACGLFVAVVPLLPLLAALVRFEVPSAAKIDLTAYITVPVLLVGAFVMHPSGPVYPGNDHFRDRISWARDQLGGRYEPVEQYLRRLALDEEFGPERDFAPFKMVRADQESLRGNWGWRNQTRKGRCYVYMRQEEVDGVFRPLPPKVDNGRTAFCFELGGTRVLVFDWRGELVLSYEGDAIRPPSLAEFLQRLSL